jgi:hypothetical protein
MIIRVRLVLSLTVLVLSLMGAVLFAGTGAATPLRTSLPAARAMASTSGASTSVWGSAEEIPGVANLGAYAELRSISCGSSGNCAAGGDISDGAGHYQAFVVNQVNGSWGNAQEVPGIATIVAGSPFGARVTSISCASAGNCAAGGYAGVQAFVVDEVNRTWGSAEKVPGIAALSTGPGTAWVTSISCVCG